MERVAYVASIGSTLRLAAVLALTLALAGCAQPAPHAQALSASPAFPTVASTLLGQPCDPINVELVGTRDEVCAALASAGWVQADPITIASSLRMFNSVMLESEYLSAPMSNLYLYGRPQDLGFEQIQISARRRHHVRLWRSDRTYWDGRPIWVGSAIYDTAVSVTITGQVIHRIDSDIDAERDKLVKDLRRHGQVVSLSTRRGLGATVNGRNATGDTYMTDGQVRQAVLTPSTPVVASATYSRPLLAFQHSAPALTRLDSAR